MFAAGVTPVFSGATALAQEPSSVTGQVIGGYNDPVVGASVAVLEAGTSTVVDTVVADNYGWFQSGPLEARTYDIRLTDVEHDPLVVAGVAVNGATELGILVMTPIWGSFHGQAVFEGTNDPIDGAILSLMEVGTTNVVTSERSDGDGWWWSSQIAAGIYDLRVTHDDFEPITIANVDVVGSTYLGSIEMSPIPGDVSFQVLNWAGDPVDGATVSIYEFGTGVLVLSGSTDGDGWYYSGPVARGRYDIEVVHGASYPRTLEDTQIDEATQLDPVVLDPLPTAAISGYVLDTSGEPIDGARIRAVHPGGSKPLATAYSDAQGWYETSMFWPGTREVLVTYSGYSTVRLPSMTISEPVLLDDIILSVVWNVPVQVYDDLGGNIAGAEVSLLQPGTEVVVKSGITGRYGQVDLDETPEGTYDLRATHDEFDTFLLSGLVVDRPHACHNRNDADPVGIRPRFGCRFGGPSYHGSNGVGVRGRHDHTCQIRAH